jgi:hypothetical protein
MMSLVMSPIHSNNVVASNKMGDFVYLVLVKLLFVSKV